MFSNAGSGFVPKAPPMISMVTIGNANTNVSTSGSRVISRSSARTSRPTVLIAVLLSARRQPGGPLPVEQAEQGVFQAGLPDAQVGRDGMPAHQDGAGVGDDAPV